MTRPEAILSAYGLRIEHTGESMDNILKVHYIKKYHPDVALFVQTSPAFCCPSLVTEAMARRIEAVTGVPVVSITYDGTGGVRNDAVIPYLKYPRRRSLSPALRTVCLGCVPFPQMLSTQEGGALQRGLSPRRHTGRRASTWSSRGSCEDQASPVTRISSLRGISRAIS